MESTRLVNIFILINIFKIDAQFLLLCRAVLGILYLNSCFNYFNSVAFSNVNDSFHNTQDQAGEFHNLSTENQTGTCIKITQYVKWLLKLTST